MIMFHERLPYARLMMLADLTDTLEADVNGLEELAAYALRADTGGTVHRELARAFVPNQSRLRRLHAAGLIHDPQEAADCCGMPGETGHWTLHRGVLDAALW
jgi:hypothetical protein